MTTWAMIGSGNIGSTVARLALEAGHEVVLSNSRGPQTLQDLVDELGPGARAATPENAAADADVVVVTIPLKALGNVPVEPLRGKIVIDTMNYYPERDGHIATLDEESTTTSQMVQAHLPDSAVVKHRVTQLFDDIGYDVLDLVPLAEGWRTQRDTAGYALLYAADPEDWSAGPRPVTADQVAEHTAQSRRYRDM